MTQQLLSDLPFSSLDLEPALAKGAEAAGFRYCTEIQAQALPLALCGRDVAGQARTGTGKTAAFLLAAMNRIIRNEPGDRASGQPRILILAPTRELAVQIHKDAEQLGQFTGLRIGVVFGGTGYESQREMLREGLDILVGTPGRLIDYFKQRVFNLDHVQVAVLDEADRMFDLGFIRDIRYVLRRIPPPEKRLSMLFSATLSYRVMELAYEHMNNPTSIDAVKHARTVEQVSQVLFHVGQEEKIALLLGLLQEMDATRTLVFVNTKRMAETLVRYLGANKLDADVLSGDVPQRKRLKLLERFTNGDLAVLVATDVAARGLHIPDVSHVFNFDLPQDPEDYVHRIGRTARAGASGDAVSFACEQYVYSLMEIEEFIGMRIPTRSVSEELLVRPVVPPRRAKRARPQDGDDRRRTRRRADRRGERKRR